MENKQQRTNPAYPLVSVIFPMFNVEDSVLNSLGTVQDQTYDNLEIICIDDGSSDKSLEYAKSFANDPRIKFIAQQNRGLGGARNAGLDAAIGDWITFVDSDDWIKPDMIAKLVDKAISGDYDIVDCLHIILSPVGEVMATRQHVIDEEETDYFVQVLSGRYPVHACARLFRRSLIGETRFPEKTLHEDLYVVYRLFHAARRAATVPEVMYIWNNRVGSISRSSSKKHVDDVFGCFDDAWDFLCDHNLQKVHIGAFHRRCARLVRGVFQKTKDYSTEVEQREVQDYLRDRIVKSEYFSPEMLAHLRAHEKTLLAELSRYPDFMKAMGIERVAPKPVAAASTPTKQPSAPALVAKASAPKPAVKIFGHPTTLKSTAAAKIAPLRNTLKRIINKVRRAYQ